MASKQGNKGCKKGEVDLNWVLHYLRDGVYPPGLNFTEKRMVRKRAERFCYLKGDLYYVGTPTDQSLGKKTRFVLLTEADKWSAVEQCHIDSEGTHLGLERTADGITAKYYWNGIYGFIKDFIRQCSHCVSRHPNMLAPTGRASMETVTGEVNSDGLVEENVYVIEYQDQDATSSKVPVQDVSLIDLRLLGPYEFNDYVHHVLIGVGGNADWVEAYVLDIITAASISNSLLQMIGRHGQVSFVTMSEKNKKLSPSLMLAIKHLKEDSNINIKLQQNAPERTSSLMQEAKDVIEAFIEAQSDTWPEEIDLCLTHSCLPLRLARQQTSSSASLDKKSLSMDSDEGKAAEALMSVRRAVISSGEPTTPVATPLISTPTTGKGIITRSRTGVTKPKTLDQESYETPAAGKRRLSAGEDAGGKKRVRVELVNALGSVKVVTPVTARDVSSTLDSSDVLELSENEPTDSEAEMSQTEATAKKVVDLDTYYEAIKLYVDSGTYPVNASKNFKRLIRDQAKNYTIKKGDLYHEVGVKGQVKKIVMRKEERMRLLMEAHLKMGKQNMLTYLDHVHWKGKQLDAEAFVLASPLSDKTHLRVFKETSLRIGPDTQKQLELDREDNYTEISNYLIYEVFSDDLSSQRLEPIKRQLRNFHIEGGYLVHATGSRRQRVLQTATERKLAISEAHLKKGAHADCAATFNQLFETSFWFGMKLDVKIFTHYCCSNENKHLLERYFAFREHHMKNPMTSDMLEGEGEREVGAQGQGEITEGVEQGETTVEEVTEAEIANIVPAHYISTAAPTAIGNTDIQPSIEHETSESSPEPLDQSHMIVMATALQGNNEGNPLESSLTVCDLGEGSGYLETGEATVEINTTEIPEVKAMKLIPPTRIMLRVTPEGNTLIVNEDGSETLARHAGQVISNMSSSDDVTLAAVKSILQDAGALGSNEFVVHTSTVSQSQSEPQQPPQPGSQIKVEERVPDVIEAGTCTLEDEDEEEEDSDTWMNESDEDDENEYGDTEGEPKMEVYKGEDGAQRRVPTPRQHFKCSQCNKIFYGPLKFKMHMYKHTGQKPFPCNHCHKKYTNKKSLVIHQRTHTGELPYLCSLCGRRCASKIALKSHLKCHDGQGGGFPAQCDICQRMFSRKHLMERHKMHKHTNHQTEFKCTECSKVFGHQRSLRRHFMSTHLNVKNHVCGLCGKSFYRKEYLTGHLVQHGGVAAEGLARRSSRTTFKPRPSVFNQESSLGDGKSGEEVDDIDAEIINTDTQHIQRIILHQDEHGHLRVVDMATEQQVKRMLEARGFVSGKAGETMVVQIEEPGGEPQVVHVENAGGAGEDDMVEGTLEYHHLDGTISHTGPDSDGSMTQYMYATSSGDVAMHTSSGEITVQTSSGEITVQTSGTQELMYGQPAVQYEVECVGEVGDEEALSAINLLAQASAQQYEISQI
ncbi:uncharacterized protein LOC127866613 isoform X2 [Dreissena polymorpha]|uniref:uncharacterized protein LOC127866613 isoform X2 n=1 Tax=Dreissena polymorpha TaxID=45954 RepID=UPI002264E879|nr:uncharacterized protein LOC127866613 isoform X2 [Dreissena polymorpha]